MLRVFLLLFSILFATENIQTSQHDALEYRGAFNGYLSFMEMKDAAMVRYAGEFDPISFYKPPGACRPVASGGIFRSGLMMVNIKRPKHIEHDEFRLVFSEGSSSDSLDLPGVRHISLSLFSKQVQNCVDLKLKQTVNILSSIKVETSTSVLSIVFPKKHVQVFLRCFISTIQSSEYLDKESYSSEVAEISRHFKEVVSSFVSIEADKLAIRSIYSSIPEFGSPAMRVSSIFSESRNNKASNYEKALPNTVKKLIPNMFKPQNFSIIFYTSLETYEAKKYIFSLTDWAPMLSAGSEQAKSQRKAAIEKANKAIKNMGSCVIVRKGSPTNVLRIYIPFITDDLRSLSSNGHIIVMAILSSRHRGGVLNFLFINGFVDRIKVDYYVEHSTIMIYIEIYLSEKGTQNVPLIIDSVVSYMNLIKKTSTSREVFADARRIFDNRLSSSDIYLMETIEHYVNSHLIIPSKSPGDIFKNKINAYPSDSEIEYFISKMSLESVVATLFVRDQSGPVSSLFRRDDLAGLGKDLVEPHSNVRLTVFKMEDIFQSKLHEKDASHAKVFGLYLTREEAMGFVHLPTFFSKPILNKINLLHESMDIYYRDLLEVGRSIKISHTMSFKSVTTSKVWYTNTAAHDRFVKLQLKLGMHEWSNMAKEVTYPVSTLTVVTALHKLTAILNMEAINNLKFMLRFGALVEFIPPQLYHGGVSEPFEVYLIVKSPINYLALVMSEVSKILKSPDIVSYGSVSNSREFAVDTLIRLKSERSSTERNIDIISQMVSNMLCSFEELEESLMKDMDVKLVQAVHSSILSSPIIYGYIEGNLTPFHANHILNMFIESLGHKFFLKEANESNTKRFLTPVSYDAPTFRSRDSVLSRTNINAPVLDVNTVPHGNKKLLVNLNDPYIESMSSAIAILIGELSVENLSRSSMIRAAIKFESSAGNSFNGGVKLSSNIHVVANKFLIILVSVDGGQDIDAGSSARILDERFNSFLDGLPARTIQKNYLAKIKKISLGTLLSLMDQGLFLSPISPLNLALNSKKHMASSDVTAFGTFLGEVQYLPRVFIITSGGSSEEKCPTYIPQGYKSTGGNYKLLFGGKAQSTRDCRAN